ncbi:MAG TPA: hypothetical protein VM735_12690 [Candidatus Kapabacteria bacterium]|jgi:hypothetical protein|nr:hypothetical protein [Candidatus Kapabacteria bacterium]
MPTQEISSSNWKEFCDRFVELHRGTLMTVMKVDPSGQSHEVVRDRPLTKAWMDTGECNDRIFLDFESNGKRELIHEIVEPIHVKLREEAQGRKGLQIDAEDGSTLVLFSSGRLQELLSGLKHH